MRFFIPEVNDPVEAERVYEATKKFARETLGWNVESRRIQSIDFKDKKERVRAEVGKPDPITGEVVIVILESTTYLICTPNRGVLRGMPILVGKNEVFNATDFET
jgi:hypothetical protein